MIRYYRYRCDGICVKGTLHCDEGTDCGGWEDSLADAVRCLSETAGLCGADAQQEFSLLTRDVDLGAMESLDGKRYQKFHEISDAIRDIVRPDASDTGGDVIWSGTGRDAAAMEVVHTSSGCYQPAHDDDGTYLDSGDAWVAEFVACGGTDE